MEPLRRLRDPDEWLFLALLLLQLVPLWTFRCFPSQDGPAHLENAVLLRDYFHPYHTWPDDVYIINTRFDPNWFGHLVLGGLLSFLPVLAAEKVLLSGYLILLPLAVRFALNAIRPGAGFLAVLVFPFVPNFLYHMGFYNFSFSLVLFFVTIGYWLRHQQHFGPRQTLVLALLAILLYFCHLVSLVMAVMAIGVLGLAWTLLDRGVIARQQRNAHKPEAPTKKYVVPSLALQACGRFVLAGALWPLAAFAPALILGIAFLGRQGTAATSEQSLAGLWDHLRQLEVLVSYLNLERLLSTVLFWALAGLAVWVLARRLHCRQLERRDLLLLVAGLALVAYFAAPSALAGGSFVNTRLSLFPFFFLILWLGVHSFSPVLKRLIQFTAAGVTLTWLVCHTVVYAEFNDYLSEYLSVEPVLQPGSTVLPLTFRYQLRTPDNRLASVKVGVFRHAAGYLAARSAVIDLENYEAATGYFPVRFKPEVNPFEHIGIGGFVPDHGLQAQPPCVEFLTYAERTGGRPVDFVLLWNVLPEQCDTPAGRSILQQLKQGYELTYTSSPRGLLQLYRRRTGSQPSCSSSLIRPSSSSRMVKRV